MNRLFLLLLLSLFSTFSVGAQEEERIDLSKSVWEYRWGDSPFEDDVPLWAVSDEDASNWHSIDYPADPPERNGQTNIWYRVKLPQQLTKDPHFYAFSMDLLPEVYYKGERIYHFGTIGKNGVGEYAGWPWHLFPLPQDSGGEYLYIRLYSNYLDIGLFGEILVTPKGELIKKFLDDDIPKLMVGAVALFVGCIFLISYMSLLKRFELFVLGSLFVTQGFNVLCAVKITQLYFIVPLLNQFISASAFFYFPVGMALYLDTTLNQTVPFSLIRRMWQIHLVYLVCAIGGALLGLYEIPATYEYFDMLYYFVTLPIISALLIYYFVKGDGRTRLITGSFMIVCSYQVHSFLIAYQIFPWVENPRDLAVFLCLLILSYSIVKNLHYTQTLENENEVLTALNSVDHLTQLYNRKELDEHLKEYEGIYHRYGEVFSIILMDIDNFKRVNDEFGHLVGDQFLVELGQLLTSYTREVDLVGRWGGEEFIILCPRTQGSEAVKMAENLRKRIEANQFTDVGNKTVSFGVSSVKKGDTNKAIFIRADEALYQSKRDGRNRVSFVD